MARLFDDGSNEYLRYAGAILSVPPFSMSVWFYTDTAAVFQTMVTIGDFSSANVLHRLAADTNNRIRATSNNNDSWRNATTSTTWSVDTWNHACGVWASTSSRASYLNAGGKATDANLSQPVNLDSTAIGANQSGGGLWVSGRLAEAAIWNVALTDLEVWLLAQGTPPWLIRPASLVGFWLPFADHSDRDFSGRGFHMTAFNTPTWAPDPPKIIEMRRGG